MIRRVLAVAATALVLWTVAGPAAADPGLFTRHEFRRVEAAMTRAHVETDVCGGCAGVLVATTRAAGCPVHHIAYPNTVGGRVVLAYRRCHTKWRTYVAKEWCGTAPLCRVVPL